MFFFVPRSLITNPVQIMFVLEQSRGSVRTAFLTSLMVEIYEGFYSGFTL